MAIWLIPRAEHDEAITPTGLGELIFRRGEDGSDRGRLQVGQFLDADATPATYQFIDVTEADIPDGSISLDKLAELDTDSVLFVDSNGRLQVTTMAAGTLLARDTGGPIVPQKLKESMVEDGTIPLDKLVNIQPGQVLGVSPTATINPGSVPVEAIDISSFAGSEITSSESAPDEAKENDLWYYCGQQSGDNARLYIYQQGMWVDASPPILNNEPGPSGPQGESVESVVVAPREPLDDIVIEFYNDPTIHDEDTLISSITISRESIATASTVPDAPATAGNYDLNVADGTASWVPAESGIASIVRQDQFYVITQQNIDDAGTGDSGDHLTLTPASFGLPTSTIISPLHSIYYQGFTLIAGNDYIFDQTLNNIVIHRLTVRALTAGQTIDLTNFV